MKSPSPHCNALSSPNIPTFSLSVFIVFGILISYLPQHYRIISRRSSEGLSPYFVLLGTTSSTFAIANILTLPASQEDIGCCKEISGVACLAGLLGIAQVAVQWACFNLIMLLWIIFFPTPGPEDHPSDAPAQPTYRDALRVVFICVAHTTIVVILSTVFLLWYPRALLPWATFLGISAAILACIQYIPQLYTTYRLQHVMSLSVPMMCIQTPGSFVFAFSLGLRLGWGGWSAWGVYIVTGLLQGGLLVMGIQFELRDRKKRAQEEQPDREGERAPLLGGANGNGDSRTNGHSAVGERSYAAIPGDE
ncbi:PQ loop repeat protein [Tothia fuscella]|uniref:PQ loop repeat protein n=1 Tax=Tothia fuscella TaxID=1048955 RepID=A0A9P4NN91_9PEZI|nr:PQ loop repeat protein [Tothia fuscella]